MLQGRASAHAHAILCELTNKIRRILLAYGNGIIDKHRDPALNVGLRALIMIITVTGGNEKDRLFSLPHRVVAHYGNTVRGAEPFCRRDSHGRCLESTAAFFMKAFRCFPTFLLFPP